MITGTSNDFWLQDILSALSYSVAENFADSTGPQPPYNDLTQFLLEQQAKLPDYLVRPMGLATKAFDLTGCLRAGHRFHTQPAIVRAAQIASWKKSRQSARRDLMRYYESLATLAVCSRPSLAENPTESPKNASSTKEATEANPQVITRPDKELRCQIAVIGSGPGGALTACLLSEAGLNVLLIEEGPFLPLESCAPFSIEEMRQKYRNGGQTVALGRNKVAYVEGRCVGGGSEINSGLYHRTPSEILERWRKSFQVEALTEADLEPHFAACEKELSVSSLPGAAPAPSRKLQAGAAALGWRSVEVPRWFRYQDGSGARQSMTRTFVPRFFKAGGRLLPLTRVQRLRQEDGKWHLFARHTARTDIRITAESVFVCGGAVQSPALLRRSGITQNIGNSLRLHPTVKVLARFADDVNEAGIGVPTHQVKEFAPELSFGCSISSRPYLALGLLDHPERLRTLNQSWQRMANYYAMVAGDSSGTVRVLPRFGDPLVRYHLSEADRRKLTDGLRKLSQLLFEAGAQELYPAFFSKPMRTPDELRHLPEVLPDGRSNLMTIHLFSSCPMGENRARCAVDSFGRVHGFDNLFIADASLLCTAPGVNPQGTILALARRNAMHFIQERR